MSHSLPRLLLALGASLLLVLPMGSVSAAKAHPWSAYFPAKGVTCTSVTTRADGTTENQNITVVTKTAKKIVTRLHGQGRTTSLLLPGGRLRGTSSISYKAGGIRARFAVLANYPSPARLIRHGSGSAKVTMTMTLPRRMAEVLLKSGRTVTLTGNYRVAGLGSDSITLADSAGTVVAAIGSRVTLRSFSIKNAKPAAARGLRREMRPLFASLSRTDWIARGRGTVLSTGTDVDGAALTQRQVGCS